MSEWPQGSLVRIEPGAIALESANVPPDKAFDRNRQAIVG